MIQSTLLPWPAEQKKSSRDVFLSTGSGDLELLFGSLMP